MQGSGVVDARMGCGEDGERRLVKMERKRRMMFIGWRWICQECGGKVKMLYWPLWTVCAWNLLEDDDPPVGSEDGMPAPCREFKCGKCHGVKSRPLGDVRTWNENVMRMSGSLLYGKDVERPEWI